MQAHILAKHPHITKHTHYTYPHITKPTHIHTPTHYKTS